MGIILSVLIYEFSFEVRIEPILMLINRPTPALKLNWKSTAPASQSLV